MEEMFDYLHSVHELSPECIEFLKSRVQVKILKKKQYLLRPGEICRNMYYIQKGLLRCFYFFNEKEVIDWFFWERDTVVSVPSYYRQVPSMDFIQGLEPCELFFIPYADLEFAYKKYMEFNYVGRVLTLKYLLIWNDLGRAIKGRNVQERYDYLMQWQPEVFNQVPLGDLARWLDMDPSTLSRLRGKRN
jgi:hypothetical protein